MEALHEALLESRNVVVELALPSDRTPRERQLASEVSELRHELVVMDAKYKGLEMMNKVLQRRIASTINDWKASHAKLRLHEHSDVLCDFITEYYHGRLLARLRQVLPDDPPASWTEVCSTLNREEYEGKDDLKQLCLTLTGFTDAEWQAVYEYKKLRNSRVHPRRNTAIVQKLLRDLPAGDLKTALGKMFKSVHVIGL